MDNRDDLKLPRVCDVCKKVTQPKDQAFVRNNEQVDPIPPSEPCICHTCADELGMHCPHCEAELEKMVQ